MDRGGDHAPAAVREEILAAPSELYSLMDVRISPEGHQICCTFLRALANTWVQQAATTAGSRAPLTVGHLEFALAQVVPSPLQDRVLAVAHVQHSSNAPGQCTTGSARSLNMRLVSLSAAIAASLEGLQDYPHLAPLQPPAMLLIHGVLDASAAYLLDALASQVASVDFDGSGEQGVGFVTSKDVGLCLQREPLLHGAVLKLKGLGDAPPSAPCRRQSISRFSSEHKQPFPELAPTPPTPISNDFAAFINQPDVLSPTDSSHRMESSTLCSPSEPNSADVSDTYTQSDPKLRPILPNGARTIASKNGPSTASAISNAHDQGVSRSNSMSSGISVRSAPPKTGANVCTNDLCLSFEKLLMSDETKKITLTPNRLRTIEVKKEHQMPGIPPRLGGRVSPISVSLAARRGAQRSGTSARIHPLDLSQAVAGSDPSDDASKSSPTSATPKGKMSGSLGIVKGVGKGERKISDPGPGLDARPGAPSDTMNFGRGMPISPPSDSPIPDIAHGSPTRPRRASFRMSSGRTELPVATALPTPTTPTTVLTPIVTTEDFRKAAPPAYERSSAFSPGVPLRTSAPLEMTPRDGTGLQTDDQISPREHGDPLQTSTTTFVRIPSDHLQRLPHRDLLAVVDALQNRLEELYNTNDPYTKLKVLTVNACRKLRDAEHEGQTREIESARLRVENEDLRARLDSLLSVLRHAMPGLSSSEAGLVRNQSATT